MHRLEVRSKGKVHARHSAARTVCGTRLTTRLTTRPCHHIHSHYFLFVALVPIDPPLPRPPHAVCSGCVDMSASSPLPSSSPASLRTANGRRTSLTGQLAFLVHSPQTVANHMPPEVDNKALARQKRRRTRYVVHAASTSAIPSQLWC